MRARADWRPRPPRKGVSADLTRRVAKALNLREDYMGAQIAFVAEHLSDDPARRSGPPSTRGFSNSTQRMSRMVRLAVEALPE